MSDIKDTINRLAELDGVKDVSVSVKLNVNVRKNQTGVHDRVGNPVRERAVEPEDIAAIIGDSWDYSPNVDVVNDFWVTDRLQYRTKIGGENNE